MVKFKIGVLRAKRKAVADMYEANVDRDGKMKGGNRHERDSNTPHLEDNTLQRAHT